MIRWQDTRAAMRADRMRLHEYYAAIPGAPREKLYLHAGYVAVFLYRIAHYLHGRGWRRVARLVRLVDLLATGADFDPAASIGPGLVVPNPQTVSVYGRIGANCVLMAQTSIGWPKPTFCPGEPIRLGQAVLGDDVELEPGALVIGTVRIGNRVRIGARCLVMEDVADDTDVFPLETRIAKA